MVKKISIVLLCLATLFIGAKTVIAHDGHDQPYVYLTPDGFNPSDITIYRGDSVSFINIDQVDHWPASNFDPQKPIKPSEVWSYTFNESGVWEYHDNLFPKFKGSITVEETNLAVDPVTMPSASLLDRIQMFFTQLFAKLFSRQ